MATFPLTYLNCDFPGPGGFDFTYFGTHPYEVMRGWRTTGWATTGFKLKPLIVWLHGGLGQNQGNQGLNLTSTTSWLIEMHETHGWPIVTVDFPPVEQTSDHKRTPASARLWPAHVFSVARAVQQLKARWNDPVLWGVDGAGATNTIDPEQIVVGGFSYGGTLAMLLAMMPTSRLPQTTELFMGRSSKTFAGTHLPRAVVYDDAQVDWTQFSFNPSQTVGTYKDNRHQVFTWYEDGMEWGNTYLSPGVVTVPTTAVPIEWKKAASPWWWAAAAFPEALSVAHVGSWAKATHTDPDQTNLVPADWSPGTQRLAEDLGKAWYDPHHNFQAKPWGDLLDQLGLLNRILWGNATTNPNGYNRDLYNPNTFIPDFLLNTVGLG